MGGPPQRHALTILATARTTSAWLLGSLSRRIVGLGAPGDAEERNRRPLLVSKLFAERHSTRRQEPVVPVLTPSRFLRFAQDRGAFSLETVCLLFSLKASGWAERRGSSR